MLHKVISFILGIIALICLLLGLYFLGSWLWQSWQDYQPPSDSGEAELIMLDEKNINANPPVENDLTTEATTQSEIEAGTPSGEAPADADIQITPELNRDLDELLFSEASDDLGANVLSTTLKRPQVRIFDDPACDSCQRYWQGSLESFLQQKPDDIVVTVHTIPVHGDTSLEQMRWLRCAAAQDKHDLVQQALWDNSEKNIQTIKEVLGQEEFDEQEFDSCLTSDILAAQLATDLEIAELLGVTAVPTTFIGDRGWEGFVPLENLLHLTR